MHYIINKKVLSLPPYISTSWENVISLHIENEENKAFLVVELKQGTKIKIPQLDSEVITKIFQAHTSHLEDHSETTEPPKTNQQQSAAFPFNLDNMAGIGFPMKFGVNLEGLGAAMQHNPEQANAPDLPKEVIEKISAVSKIMDAGPNLTADLKAEPHCNCIHCQVARAIHGEIKEETPSEIEEEVTDEDLKFKTWDIAQTGDKLYSVTNPLDTEEQYSVYLGQPLGCTCGKKNCEHIKAVLNT